MLSCKQNYKFLNWEIASRLKIKIKIKQRKHLFFSKYLNANNLFCVCKRVEECQKGWWHFGFGGLILWFFHSFFLSILFFSFWSRRSRLACVILSGEGLILIASPKLWWFRINICSEAQQHTQCSRKNRNNSSGQARNK